MLLQLEVERYLTPREAYDLAQIGVPVERGLKDKGTGMLYEWKFLSHTQLPISVMSYEDFCGVWMLGKPKSKLNVVFRIMVDDGEE